MRQRSSPLLPPRHACAQMARFARMAHINIDVPGSATFEKLNRDVMSILSLARKVKSVAAGLEAREPPAPGSLRARWPQQPRSTAEIVAALDAGTLRAVDVCSEDDSRARQRLDSLRVDAAEAVAGQLGPAQQAPRETLLQLAELREGPYFVAPRDADDLMDMIDDAVSDVGAVEAGEVRLEATW